MRNVLLRLARCTSGTASIEVIIVLPLAISLMAGGIEFGRIFSTYSTAEKSMRNAARYLSRLPTQDAICDWGLTNAQNLAVYGKISPAVSDQPLIPNWTAGTVAVAQCTAGAFDDPPVISISASVPFTSVMLSVVGIGNSFTLTPQHQERYVGE